MLVYQIRSILVVREDPHLCKYSSSPLGPASGAMRSSALLISSRTSSSPGHHQVRIVSIFNSLAEGLTVLVQAQRTTSVLYKEVQNANFVLSKLRQSSNNLISDEIGAPRLRRQRELLLEPSHG